MTAAQIKGRVVRLTGTDRKNLAICAGAHGRSRRAELEAIVSAALAREAKRCRNRRGDAR